MLNFLRVLLLYFAWGTVPFLFNGADRVLSQWQNSTQWQFWSIAWDIPCQSVGTMFEVMRTRGTCVFLSFSFVSVPSALVVLGGIALLIGLVFFTFEASLLWLSTSSWFSTFSWVKTVSRVQFYCVSLSAADRRRRVVPFGRSRGLPRFRRSMKNFCFERKSFHQRAQENFYWGSNRSVLHRLGFSCLLL